MLYDRVQSTAGGKAGPPPQLKNMKQDQDGSTDREDEPAQNPDCDPEFVSGEEDYMDSDFEGREGYRKGVCLPSMLSSTATALPSLHHIHVLFAAAANYIFCILPMPHGDYFGCSAAAVVYISRCHLSSIASVLSSYISCHKTKIT